MPLSSSSTGKIFGTILTTATFLQSVSAQSDTNSSDFDIFKSPVIMGTLLVAVPGLAVTTCALLCIGIEKYCMRSSSDSHAINNRRNDDNRRSFSIFNFCKRNAEKDLETAEPLLEIRPK